MDARCSRPGKGLSTRATIIALASACVTLAMGCTTTQRYEEEPDIRLTGNPEEVRGCRNVGYVNGSSGKWLAARAGGDTILTYDGKTGTAYDCSQLTVGPTLRSSTAEPDSTASGCVFVGKIDTVGCNDECVKDRVAEASGNFLFVDKTGGVLAYRCPHKDGKAAPPFQTEPPQPATAGPATPAKVRVVSSETEIRGCTFLDPIDEKISCPEAYPQGVPCMGYRGAKQGGNTVLASGAGKVYSCAAKP